MVMMFVKICCAEHISPAAINVPCMPMNTDSSRKLAQQYGISATCAGSICVSPIKRYGEVLPKYIKEIHWGKGVDTFTAGKYLALGSFLSVFAQLIHLVSTDGCARNSFDIHQTCKQTEKHLANFHNDYDNNPEIKKKACAPT